MNALWFACFSRSLPIIDLLCAAGIDLDNQNENGATCLMYAASAGRADVVERLLAHGADASLRSLDGFSALDMVSSIECFWLLRSCMVPEAQAAGGHFGATSLEKRV